MKITVTMVALVTLSLANFAHVQAMSNIVDKVQLPAFTWTEDPLELAYGPAIYRLAITNNVAVRDGGPTTHHVSNAVWSVPLRQHVRGNHTNVVQYIEGLRRVPGIQIDNIKIYGTNTTTRAGIRLRFLFKRK